MLKLKLLNQRPRSRRCRFSLSAMFASQVVVTGDFCDWQPEGRPLKRAPDGVWRTTLLIPPGVWQYRFRVDGEWRDDPACAEREPNPFGSENCVLRIESKTTKPRFSPMTSSELNHYRKALQELAAPLARNLARDQRELLRLEEPDGGGSLRSTEDETNEGLREVEIGLIANESGLLEEVTAALQRMDAGAFGQCVTCGKKISKARLEALPHARECINCANASQTAAQ